MVVGCWTANQWAPGSIRVTGPDSISYKFPETLNDMDDDIKDTMHSYSLWGFKNYIKQLYFDSDDVNCEIANCPSCN